mmetsp:Transcript_19407/g.33298  ORF Transcript_19407/g.33298 Transcript_19407/m.33298 type:complete len:517 (+) Transcript_19407:176-1726(+)|eukprot:CAMPEP_0183703120 /NCGR_PEP_ID=MMETSP0737-20130205/981_1 /TAXON_ID=385413 /ORGANISM="Thalassiosira miniscula, Strain CCMP1093" /LENGTH=516 /DNA_ID=CAMNT_0025929825 /DNA_START=181 /DNA_END=1731 /DNA_ORIENTATION=-
MEPFVFALATLSLVDSISFMIVTPSLAFYINSLGGSQDYYGFVLAIYSFSSFCGKPLLGRWSDAYNFQVPYMVSISFSVLGGLFYAIAPAFVSSKTSLASVTLGRVLGGLGRANSALGFAYVARACPASERTSITALLGGVQMIGMAIAPLFSACVVNVNFTLGGVQFDNLNTIGLLLVLFNLASQVIVYMLLPDLPKVKDGTSDEEGDKESEWLRMFRCILCNPHVGVPFLTIFTFNFNWQFIETALAPAAFDSLGWGPVEISYVLGAMAFLVFFGMTAVHKLSQSGVKDLKLLCWGLFGNTIGYLMLYALWYRGVGFIVFTLPVFVGAGTFPFLGAPNRSMFSAAVDSTPELSGYEGTMQALLSMSSSVGGFTAPGMITHYCLRTPEEVSMSNDDREFTPTALFSPLLSLFVLIATYMTGELENEVDLDEEIEVDDEESFPHEKMPLVEDVVPRRRSDGDTPSKMESPGRPGRGRPSRRRSMIEVEKDASVRGSMFTPMTLIPRNAKEIYGDDT